MREISKDNERKKGQKRESGSKKEEDDKRELKEGVRIKGRKKAGLREPAFGIYPLPFESSPHL